MRPGQHNKNRGRNRNRRHNSGSQGGGSGSSPNRVFESNGPDVKVRGTSQTIAEKYNQLGRDALSSGDTVMAENYYQHAEHYYRIWAANQPPGAILPMFRKAMEEEFEGEAADGEAEGEAPEGEAPEGAEAGGEAADMTPPEGAAEGEGAPPQNQRPFRQRDNRDNRDNNGGDNREGRRDRFRPRWQNRRDQQDYRPREGQEGEPEAQPAPRAEAAEAQAPGQWEAPSFLRRPAAAAGEEGETPKSERRPRRARPVTVEDGFEDRGETPPTTPGDGE